MATAMVEDSNFEEDQLASMTTDDIVRASCLLDNEIQILKEEVQRTSLELDSFKEKIKENQEKIKLNKQLPYLVGNIVKKMKEKKMVQMLILTPKEKGNVLCSKLLLDRTNMFFSATILTMVICVANWNGYAKSETVYKWMEIDFAHAILFWICVTMELGLASGMGLDLFGGTCSLPCKISSHGWNLYGSLSLSLGIEYPWFPVIGFLK